MGTETGISAVTRMKQSDDETWTYEQYPERLDAWLKKHAQRKVLKSRRTEHDNIKRVGGGKAAASLLLKPITRKHK